GARHPPADEAAQAQAENLGDAFVPAERGDLAEHPVAVRLGWPREVLGEPPGLAEGVLAGRRIGPVAARVRDIGTVAERPDVLVATHAQKLVDLDMALLVERQRPLAQSRVRSYARRPDERVRRDLCPVAEDRLLGRDRC